MPYRAKLHFYVMAAIKAPSSIIKCQCPIGPNFISTVKEVESQWQLLSLCQCPIGPNFISTFAEFLNNAYSQELCQCPIGPNFISTTESSKSTKNYSNSVNALSGQTSFLRLLKSIILRHIFLCQCPIGPNFISTHLHMTTSTKHCLVSMPYRAKLHFYVFKLRAKFINDSVSMPYRAKLPFYNVQKVCGDMAAACVNALSGQTSFLL